MDIVEALSKLDPANDDHWTADGLPAMRAIENLVGDTAVTRQQVNDAKPGFSRRVAEQTDADAGPNPDEMGGSDADPAQDPRPAEAVELEKIEHALQVIDGKVQELIKQKVPLEEERDRLSEIVRPRGLVSDPNAVAKALKHLSRKKAEEAKKPIPEKSTLDRVLAQRRPGPGEIRINRPPLNT